MGSITQLGGGRPRKPTSAKALAGTLQKCRTNPAEPLSEPIDIPDPPVELTSHEQVMWLELRALVGPMRITAAADLYAFRSMVEDAAMLRALRDSLGANDPIYEAVSKFGSQLKARPEVAAIPVYRKLMFLHMARWGINPADRSRVSVLADTEPAEDPLKDFRVP